SRQPVWGLRLVLAQKRWAAVAFMPQTVRARASSARFLASPNRAVRAAEPWGMPNVCRMRIEVVGEPAELERVAARFAEHDPTPGDLDFLAVLDPLPDGA